VFFKERSGRASLEHGGRLADRATRAGIADACQEEKNFMADLVPFDNRDGFIWFDGKLVPWREAHVHVLTHGLHYGSAVFEGERAYGGEIFKLHEHSERLVEGAKNMDFDMTYTADEIDQACRDVLKANNLTDCYVRPIAWRGSEQIGVSAQKTKIHLAIAAWEWGSYFPIEQRLKGIRVTHAKYRRPDPATAPSKTKAAGLYMICTIEKHRAERAGYADALMLDYRGRVAECTGANIFFVKDGVIHTPDPDCFLDGITRRTVIGLAERRGYEVVSRAIMPDELGSFSECFLTGTAAEVTPVSEIGDVVYKPGQITETLLNDYMNHVQPSRRAAE
jgi:branched-chain amino acid aminotransferase